jgi:hypothetical protein
MPFVVPWTDADAADLGRSSVQFHWQQRATLSPQDWTVQFLVRADGRVIGEQSLAAVDFALTREVVTGSWVGMRLQGQGYGTEMRAAVLAFAFEHLGANRARSRSRRSSVTAATARSGWSAGVDASSRSGWCWVPRTSPDTAPTGASTSPARSAVGHCSAPTDHGVD